MTKGDIQPSDYTNNEKTYLSPNMRKYMADNYKIQGYLLFNLKTSLPNNTKIIDFQFSEDSIFSNLDETTIIDANFISNNNIPTKLNGYISNGNLVVYNNSGNPLNNGKVVVNFIYDKIL